MFRRLIFCLPAEFTHNLAIRGVRWLYPPCRVKKIQKQFPKKATKVFNINFPNPIGLAAGLDKNGDSIDAWYGLGFGFIEIGAVTPLPQSGNPKPRLFRLPKAQALINRFGFNNQGVDHLVERLKKRCIDGILGVNIGKNRTTLLEDATNDYETCFRKVYPYVDFVTINISSPNTPGLQQLQGEMNLRSLLMHMKQVQQELQLQWHKHVALLIKISSDLNESEIVTIANLILETKVDGIVAVNTTQDREGVQSLLHANEAGGLSGKPLLHKTIRVIRCLHNATQGQVPIIAVGGIFSADDVKTLLAEGASLVQLYTGLIYQGPGLVREIVDQL